MENSLVTDQGIVPNSIHILQNGLSGDGQKQMKCSPSPEIITNTTKYDKHVVDYIVKHQHQNKCESGRQ